MNKLLIGLLILTAGPALSIAGSDDSTESESSYMIAKVNWQCVPVDKSRDADVSDLLIYNADGRGYSEDYIEEGKVLVAGHYNIAAGRVYPLATINDITSTLRVSWESNHKKYLDIDLDNDDTIRSAILRSQSQRGYDRDDPSGMQSRSVQMKCAIAERPKWPFTEKPQLPFDSN